MKRSTCLILFLALTLAAFLFAGCESILDVVWATAHRLGDLRRLARPEGQGGYGFGVENVYPTGTYWRGGFYGSAVVLQIPISERNNPNLPQDPTGTTCLNLNP